jgi:hypothetical protein
VTDLKETNTLLSIITVVLIIMLLHNVSSTGVLILCVLAFVAMYIWDWWFKRKHLTSRK